MNTKNAKTILLIEDNPDDALILKDALMGSGQQLFRVIDADCLKKGLDILTEGGIDIILLNLNLSDSSGLDTLRSVQSHSSNLPIVVINGSPDEALALDAVKQGAQDYLVKGEADRQMLVRALSLAIERYHLNDDMRNKGIQTRSIIDSSSDSIVIVDGDGTICFVNPAAETLFGRSAEKLLGSPFGFLITSDESIEIEILHPDFANAVVEMRTTEIFWDGKPACMASLRDITERSIQHSRVKTESLTDSLTNLYNRRAFFNIGEHHLKLLQRTNTCLTILYLDLDGLKQINDQHGHSAGDQALQATASILKSAFRETDIIARLGGDEFAILAIGTTKDVADKLTARLEQGIISYNQMKKNPFLISISWGISVALPSQNFTLEEYLNLADSQMYAQKTSKKRQL